MKLWCVFAASVFASSAFAVAPAPQPLVLKAAAFRHYAEGFNRGDEELGDNTGTRYGQGKGLRVFADGQEIAAADSLRRVTANLVPRPVNQPRSKTTAGWKKFDGNPVIGGTNGTCFDVAVLKENATYRLWLSWRPKMCLWARLGTNSPFRHQARSVR